MSSKNDLKDLYTDMLDICFDSSEMFGETLNEDKSSKSDFNDVEDQSHSVINLMERVLHTDSFAKVCSSEEKSQDIKNMMLSFLNIASPIMTKMLKDSNSLQGMMRGLADGYNNMFNAIDSDSEEAIEFRFHQFKSENSNVSENIYVLFYMNQINKFEKEPERSFFYLDRLIKYIEEHPDESISNQKKAQAYGRRAQEYHFEKKDNNAALLDVNKSLELDPNNVTTYNLRSSIHRSMENYEEALKDIETALKIEDAIELHHQRALIHDKLNKIDKANEEFEYILSNYDDDFYCGLVHYRLGNHREALLRLEREAESNPKSYKSYQAYYTIGLIYLRLGEKEKAKFAFSKIPENDPLRESIQRFDE